MIDLRDPPEFVAAFVTDRFANQRSAARGGGSLVSCESGQLTDGPILQVAGLTALLVSAIVFSSADPAGQLLLVGVALLAIPLVGLGAYIVRSQGDVDE